MDEPRLMASPSALIVIVDTAVIAAITLFGQNTTFVDAYDSTTASSCWRLRPASTAAE